MTVLDPQGNGVAGLPRGAFTVTEQSRSETVAVQESVTCFSEDISGGAGISVALVFDVSGSMAGTRIAKAKTAATNFLANVRTTDRANLVKFASYTMVSLVRASDWVSTDANRNGKRDIEESILALAASGSTAMYDGIGKGIESMSQEPRPKAVIAFSDGEENNSRVYTLNTVIAKANNEGIPVYTIALGASNAKLLEIAQKTGGAYYLAPTAQDMAAIYGSIARRLRSQYALCYTSHNPDFDGTTRDVTVAYVDASSRGSGTAAYVVNFKPQIVRDAATASLDGQSQTPGVALAIRGHVLDVDAESQGQPITMRMFYRRSGATDFTPVTVPVSPPTGGMYAFSTAIPAAAVQQPAVEYYLMASDGAVDAYAPFGYSLAPFTIPVLNRAPAISHAPVTSSLADTAVDIRADVTDPDAGDSVAAVTVHYRTRNPVQESPFFRSDMPRTAGDSFSGQIPAGVVVPPGVEYYVAATDARGVRAEHGSAQAPHFVDVGRPPVAEFAAIPSLGVFPLSVTFTDLSTGDITNRIWDFDGDGTVDAVNPAAPAVHTYTAAGTYTVRLTVSGRYGAGTLARANAVTVNVPPPPTPAFAVDPANGVSPLSVTFTDQSAGNITNRQWDFDGDGTWDSGGPETTRAYSFINADLNPRIFSPRLAAAGPGGTAIRVLTNGVTVIPPPPVASFTADPLTGPFPLRVTFADQSTGNITNRLWDFDGDGAIDAVDPIAPIVYTYMSAGTYTVRLTVTGPYGTDTVAMANFVRVDVPPAPTCDFTVNVTTGVSPLAVTFTDRSSGNITNRVWDFEDDGSPDALNPGLSVDHTYVNAGVSPVDFSARLTVSGPGGATTKAVAGLVRVIPPPPVASFVGSPLAGEFPLQVSFVDQSTGNITNRSWDFDGDGAVDAVNPTNSVVHTYTADGIFTVRLTVSGPYGAGSQTRDAYVRVDIPPAPSAGFAVAPDRGVSPLTVTFTDQSAGNATNWAWDFNGDGVADSTVAGVVRHTFVNAGDTPMSVSPSLTVGGPGGATTRTLTNAITVIPPPPVAQFTASPLRGAFPLVVAFDDTSSGNITNRQWDFDGDGAVDAVNPAAPIVHTYASDGSYAVRLTVTGPYGTGTLDRTNYVTVDVPPPPVCAFSATPTNGVSPLAVTFTDQSTGNITNRVWDFEDDGTPDAVNPGLSVGRTYVNNGADARQHSVRLTVSGPGGQDTMVLTNRVTVVPPPPQAVFAANPLVGPYPLTVTFTDQSVGNITNRVWDFDADGANDAVNPAGPIVHTYASNGSYTVQLTVAGPYGQSALARPAYVTVLIPPPPVCTFRVSPTSGVSPLAVVFEDRSTGAITNRTWDFDADGAPDSASAEGTVPHTYVNAGLAPVFMTPKLTVTGPGGSTTVALTNAVVVIPPPPSADFVAAPVTGNFPLAVAFTDLSSGNITNRAWDFDGDGAIDASNPAAPIAHIYTAAGTNTVTLTVAGPYGAGVKTRAQYIAVGTPPPPRAQFSAAPNRGVTPLGVEFTDLSSGSITNWSWDFEADGTIDAVNPAAPIRHTYQHGDADAVTYNVRLIVSGPGGVSTSTLASAVTVDPPPPTAQFSATPRRGPFPLDVVFTDLSAGNITDRAWDFNGDGATDVLNGGATVTHRYTSAGTNTVTLAVSGPYGSNTATREAFVVVEVPPPPIADFTANPTQGRTPLTVTFTDLSTGTISGRAWDFEDDGAGDAVDPGLTVIRSYFNTGLAARSVSVKLTVTGPGGSSTRTVTNLLGINPPVPVAQFEANPSRGPFPLTVTFGDRSSGNITNRLWDFNGDGTVDAVNPAAPVTHTYTSAGDKTVRLIVDGPYGADTSTVAACVTVDVPPAPDARFAVSPGAGVSPLTVTFEDLSTGNITNRAWDLDGDGTADSASALGLLRHTFVNMGMSSRVVSPALTVSGPGGVTTLVLTNAITVNPPPPVARFMADPVRGPFPLRVTFEDSSWGNITNRQWDFDGDGTPDAVNPAAPIVHTYASDGSYTVGLTVSGPYGTGTLTRTDYILVEVPPPPVCDFTASATGGVSPLAVTFTDLSAGNITNRVWDFEDDGSPDAVNPGLTVDHRYVNGGLTPVRRSVRLTVQGPGGADTKALTNLIAVIPPPPVASFVGHPLDGVFPLRVAFADQSTGNITNRSWDFDGDGADDAVNPAAPIAHTYHSEGIYTVRLTVAGPYGQNTLTRDRYVNVRVPPPPAPDFALEPAAGVSPHRVVFHDRSSGNITNRLWDFDNDGAIDAANPGARVQHVYVNTSLLTRAYSPRLVVAGPGGTRERILADGVTVTPPPPVADFSHDPAAGVAPLNVTFEDRSRGSITNRVWDFDADGSADAVNPADPVRHQYAAPGLYRVRLTVMGAGGVSSRVLADAVRVFPPPPIADFEATPTNGAPPLEVTFTDRSTGAITNRAWDFDGDGVTDAVNPAAPVRHTYAAGGRYTVTLTATGPGGLGARTRAAFIDVIPPPVAAFGASPLAGFAPLLVTFTDQSVGVITNRAWDFDNDGNVDAVNPAGAIQHTYSTPGTNSVRLVVTGPSGADTEIKHAFVVAEQTNRAPIVAVAAEQIFLPSLAHMATLDASPSSDPDGDPLFFSWREGLSNPHRRLLPRGSGIMPRIAVSFPSPGRYEFEVQVSDRQYASAETRVITVYVPGLKGVINSSPSDTVRLPYARVVAYTTRDDALNGVNPFDMSITDSRGQYVLEHLTPLTTEIARDYWLMIHRDGFLNWGPEQVTIRPDPNFDENGEDYGLGRGTLTRLAGRVLKANEDPIEGAAVSIVPGIGSEVKSDTTDVNGLFEIHFVPKGMWIVQFLAEGFRAEVRDMNVDDALTNLVVHLQEATRNATLAGRVTLTGTPYPVANARLKLGQTGEQFTDAQGAYRYENIAPGFYELLVTRDGYESLRLTTVVVKPGVNSLDVPLAARGTTLYGLIVDRTDGRPVVDAEIGIEIRPGTLWNPARSDVTGWFELSDVPTGTNRSFRVSAAGYKFRKFARSVEATQPWIVGMDRDPDTWRDRRPKDLLSPIAKVARPVIFMTNLSHSVFLDASPSVGRNLTYLWSESPNNPEPVFRQSVRAFRTNVVQVSAIRRPGIYVFDLRVENSRPSENMASVIVLAPGLAGNVHSSPSDGLFGIDRAEVRAYADRTDAEAWAGNFLDQVFSRNTDLSANTWMGDYGFERLEIGSYWIVARAQAGTGYEQYGPVRRLVNYSSAARNTAINVPRRELVFGGEVQDSATHAPLEGVRVVVAPGPRSELSRSTTDASGTFRLPAIPEGTQWIVLYREGYEAKAFTQSFLQDATDNVYTMTAIAGPGDLGSIRGQIYACYEGTNATVKCAVPHAEVMLAGVVSVFTDGDGNYRIDGLPKGVYYGIVRHPGYRSVVLPAGGGQFQLRAGETLTLDKQLYFNGQGPSVRLTVRQGAAGSVPGASVSMLRSAAILARPPGSMQLDAEPDAPDTVSDSAGVAQLNGVPYGPRGIRIRLEDGTAIDRMVNVDGDMDVSVDVEDFTPGNTFDLWRALRFIAAELADPAVGGASADPDRDGRNNWEEFISDTRPTDAGSFFGPRVTLSGRSWRFAIDQTSAGRVYDLYWKTNLLDAAWQSCGASVVGTGSNLILSVTNNLPRAFYRSSVRLP